MEKYNLKTTKNFLLSIVCLVIAVLTIYLFCVTSKISDTSASHATETKKMIEYISDDGKKIKLMVDLRLVDGDWKITGMDVVK
jgi:hypothetical protein